MGNKEALPKVADGADKSETEKAGCGHSFPVDLELFFIILTHKKKSIFVTQSNHTQTKCNSIGFSITGSNP